MKKQRFLQSWSTHNFPDDLWPDVLSRLPVKSLLRFRCVSTSWRILIDDPDFARLHLARFIPNRHGNRLLVEQYRGNVRECVLHCSETFRSISKLADLTTPVRVLRSSDALITLPAYDGVLEWEVASSIDGLFILRDSTRSPPRKHLLMLWNPSIRKVRKVPHLPEISTEMIIQEVCLGFDPVNNDYKHVRFVHSKQLSLQFVAVYSVGTNSWKKIEFLHSRWHRFFYFRGSICLRGVVYAINRTSIQRVELVSFDLSNETLDSAFLPDEVKLRYSYMQLTVADGGTSLAAVQIRQQLASMWVLQSTEDGLSWTKRYTFNLTPCPYAPRFIHLNKNGEVLLGFDGMVKFYNCETHDEMIVKTRVSRPTVWVYTESLILLN